MAEAGQVAHAPRLPHMPPSRLAVEELTKSRSDRTLAASLKQLVFCALERITSKKLDFHVFFLFCDTCRINNLFTPSAFTHPAPTSSTTNLSTSRIGSGIRALRGKRVGQPCSRLRAFYRCGAWPPNLAVHILRPGRRERLTPSQWRQLLPARTMHAAGSQGNRACGPRPGVCPAPVPGHTVISPMLRWG